MPMKTNEFKTKDFNQTEFKQIIEKAKELIGSGYFSGINFLQSEQVLPQTSIIVHFLHDSKKHINSVESCVKEKHLVVPRFTYYMLKPEYFKKPNFKEEYGNAIFFDSNFKLISIEDAVRNPQGVIVSNEELDLIVPISNASLLERIVVGINKMDRKGPQPWMDPVIIIKTETFVEILENFKYKHYVSISREKEEFYSIITDKKRMKALETYLDNLCTDTKIGRLVRSDVVFYPSQINDEFAKYLSSIQSQLKIL